MSKVKPILDPQCTATGFHITDKAAPAKRATKDIDIIVEAASIVAYHKLEKKLMQLGFFQKIQKDDPICRWYVNDIMVDVMPTDENILGFSNRWYPPAIKSSVTIELEPILEIKIVTAPYFLGTKLDAFFGREKGIISQAMIWRTLSISLTGGQS